MNIKIYFSRLNYIRRFKNESGIGILQVIMIAAVGLIISAGLMIMVESSKKSLNSQLLKLNAKLLTERYYSLLNDDVAWRNTTVANQPSMDCIRLRTDCSLSAGVFTQFTPKTIENVSYLGYDPAVATNGFSPEGSFCNTYPSARCPLRYTFWWQPVCNAGACVGKNIRIEIRADHTPVSGTVKLNTTVGQSLYSVNFVRGIPDPAKAAAICANFLRTWDPVLLVCNP